MDKHLDTEMLTPEFQEALIHLTISRYLKFVKEGSIEYEPADVLKGKNEWIGEKDEIGYVDKFKKVFEITNDEQDYIESSAIQLWITNYSVCISMTKMGIELNKYAKINNLNNVGKYDKWIDGKTKKVWRGIKFN
jgi:hypothetical protein